MVGWASTYSFWLNYLILMLSENACGSTYYTLDERTLEVQVGTPKASSVPSLKEFFSIVLLVIWKPMSCCFILKIWCGCPICCVDHFQIGWINTIALKLQLLSIAQAWQYRSVGFVNTWLLYLIIGVSFASWWLIIEKEISKIVLVKQDPVDKKLWWGSST